MCFHPGGVGPAKVNIQTDSFVPDQRSDWFACCLCTNSRCTVSHFVACRLCECNNTGNNKHWYRNHLQRKEHKQHVRNLELASQNFNSNHLVTSNDNNTESPNPYDDITVQSNDDNNDALINNTSLYDDDNEVSMANYIIIRHTVDEMRPGPRNPNDLLQITVIQELNGRPLK